MLFTVAQWAGAVSAILACLTLLIKPIRDKVMGLGAIREAQKCTLRADMLRTYYRHREDDKIRQYELENFILEYRAYKALRGNSFIDKVYKEVMGWEVIT